ncbi:hypothetical protein [Flavobacterium hibisci]|uniref:hypothetical protein n=1 Tax=Flavobacterium hibisci TaxID=1914462 RepID=UPI001CBE3C64|nr:hypothetical protein [Flavobacterium hibisci]MBZ4043565.1 hypothetical protein [Flavobacterium hibisci]
MKFKIIILFFLGVFSNLALGQELKPEYQKFIITFINNVKNDKKVAVADIIPYPFKREYPILPIKNKTEFIKRYDEIFDDVLKNEIIKSNPAKDWSEMGWRGIMLNQGTVWFDTDGRLISINYQSKFEKDLKSKIIAKEKTKLHSSIAKFKAPECVLETSKFRIRIDDLGNNNYRYASWSIKKGMNEVPDLVITKGKLILDGNGGNHRFEFKKGQYTYECSITPLREKEVSPASLTIYQNKKVILSQDAEIVPR